MHGHPGPHTRGDVLQDDVFVNVSVDFGIAYSRLHFRELFYYGRAGSLSLKTNLYRPRVKHVMAALCILGLGNCISETT